MAVFLGDGAVGTPSLRFDSDQDTGFYKLSSGAIGVASNGAGTMRFGNNLIGFGPASFNFDSSTNALVLYNGASGATEGTFFEKTPGGSANRTVGVLNNGDLVIGGTLPSAPRAVVNANGYSYNSSRFSAPQIGASDYDNFDTQTATSSLQYAVVTKSFSYSDTTTYLDVVKLGRRGSYKITVAGDDASSAFAAFHFSESILCVSDTRAQNVAPDVKFNRAGDGLDVQWKASGSTSSITTQPEYVTLQVKPQSAASNQFTVTVQVFSRYALSTATAEFNP